MPKSCPFCNADALPVERVGKIQHTGCSNDNCILGRTLYSLEKWQQRGTDYKQANFAISQQVAGMIEAAHARCPVSGFVIRDEQSRKALIGYAQHRAQDIEHGDVRIIERIATGTAMHDSFLITEDSREA